MLSISGIGYRTKAVFVIAALSATLTYDAYNQNIKRKAAEAAASDPSSSVVRDRDGGCIVNNPDLGLGPILVRCTDAMFERMHRLASRPSP